MPEQESYKERVRIQISRSVKGVFTWEATVEGRDEGDEATLARSDALVAKLNKRYPTVEA